MLDENNGFTPVNEPDEQEKVQPEQVENNYSEQPEKEFAAESAQEAPQQAERIYSNDSNDGYAQYRDPVVDDKPLNAQEPAYSPYSDMPYSQPQEAYNPNNSNYSGYSNPQPTGTKKKNKGFKAFIVAVVAVVLCVAILLGVYPYFKYRYDKVSSNTKTDDTQIKISESKTLGEASKGSAAIADMAQKFNVGILLYGRVQSFTASAANSVVGEGSGIIMGEDKSGEYTYIITCAHVIEKVKTAGYEMTVQDYKGNTYDGILVGYDVKTDIGVIKVKGTGFTAAEFGDSSELVIGQQVYAIGNPGGVEFFGSFTNGMISAIDRPINSESGYEMKCIQHTTPINSGNSGGALLNESGKVIGINSSKIVSTGYEGMAFAIPITDAKPIIDDIISNGYVTNRPKLGITYATASQYREYAMVVAFKELPAGSLIIASISEKGSLANTKAKVGDLIVAVNGEEMKSPDVLLDKIEGGKVGDTLKLTLCRINNDYSVDKFDISVKLVEDDGTGSEMEQTTTTQNYFEQFFGSGF